MAMPWTRAVTASKHPDTYERFYGRLVKVRDALAARNLAVARTVPPRFMVNLLAAVGVPAMAMDIPGRRFQLTLTAEERDAAVDKAEHLIKSWKRLSLGHTSHNALLDVIETDLAAAEAVKENRRRERQEQRALALQRLLVTPGDALHVSYSFTDEYGCKRRVVYRVKYLHLCRSSVRVGFDHTYTTLKGEHCSRLAVVDFTLDELGAIDASRSYLLMYEPVRDYNPASLKARTALCLARGWPHMDNQHSYTNIAKAVYPKMQPFDGQEDDDDSLDTSLPEVALPLPPANVHIKVEIEKDDDDVDYAMSLAMRLQTVPVTPGPGRRSILIDLTLVNDDDDDDD